MLPAHDGQAAVQLHAVSGDATQPKSTAAINFDKNNPSELAFKVGSTSQPLAKSYVLPNGCFDNNYHLLTIHWDNENIWFLVDNQLAQTITRAELHATGITGWVFGGAFRILLGVKIDNAADGDMESGANLSDYMLVDKVQVMRPEDMGDLGFSAAPYKH